MAPRKYGVVYTPDRLAVFVAKLLLEEMKKDSIDKGMILDPACGECALLNAAEKESESQFTFCGIDVDKEVVSRGAEGKNLVCNDSILPKNVKKSTDKYWIEKLGRIQAIIANPPWSSEKIYSREQLSEAGFNLIKGQYDSYVLFVELAYKIIVEGGYFAFILPDSLFDSQNISLREFLVKNTEIRIIARLGEKIFNEVNRATTVIICKKAVPRDACKTKCFRLTTDDRRAFLNGENSLYHYYTEGFHEVSQRRFSQNDNFLFDIDTREEEEILISKIKGSGIDWKDLFLFGRGVEISKAGKVVYCPYCGMAQGYKKKQLEDGKKNCSFCDKSIPVTSETTQSVVSKKKIQNSVSLCVGENLKRYKIEKGGYILKNVPGINYKDKKLYEPPKILVRKTGLGIYAAVDYSGGMTSQTVYILKKKKEDKDKTPLEYYLAMLNSRVVYYYYLKTYGENEWKSHPYLTKEIIFSLPICKYTGSKLDEEIVELSKVLMKNYNYLLDIQLEQKIFKKYKLSKEDVSLIKNEMSRLPDLSAINDMKFEVE